jgi:hypothetical protein
LNRLPQAENKAIAFLIAAISSAGRNGLYNANTAPASVAISSKYGIVGHGPPSMKPDIAMTGSFGACRWIASVVVRPSMPGMKTSTMARSIPPFLIRSMPVGPSSDVTTS